ncbi:MAG: DUF4870 domain-containing protein [Verrucomicrobia bacterium]|nr:DUF4870 domain-containing protein [Verrucomicrobiota bacterium]
MPDNQTGAPPPIQPPPPTTNAAPPVPPNPDSQARTWNMLCHLSALSAYIGIPLGNIIGPLLVWQLKKNEYPSVEIHGKAALNFQITVTIALAVTGAAMFIGFFFCIGWLLLPVVILIGLAGTVFAIIAGIKAGNGEDYKYSWSLELIK